MEHSTQTIIVKQWVPRIIRIYILSAFNPLSDILPKATNNPNGSENINVSIIFPKQ